MKVLLDGMWSPRAAAALRDRGHDVVAVKERDDLRDADDSVVADTALIEDRVIVTEDASYFRQCGIAALSGGLAFPPLILTSNRSWPRADSEKAMWRLVKALDALIVSGREIVFEHWLADPAVG